MAYSEQQDGTKEPATNSDEDKEILKEARRLLKECIDDEEEERAKMVDDLRFCTLDQWPEDIRNAREKDLENGPRPCLTIDKINQYIVQVVNDMRQGKPGIVVRPQDDVADPETAKILKGLVRNIEDQSKADIAYATSGESAAKIGLGFFRITTEYVADDSFDQEIFIRPIPNTFSTYLGKHIMPDGSDAKHGFIVESMPLEKFKEEFPKAKVAKEDFEELQDQIAYWHTNDTVTVVEYFCLKRTPQELYYLADGTTMSAADYAKWPAEAGPKPGVQDKRQSYREQLRWCKMTGAEVIEKRDLPGQYIPIVEVIGREAHVDGKRRLWGLVRPAKDSLRMYNYWASTITEKMALAPKTPYVGAVGQFATAGDRWKKANIANYSTLEYDLIEVNGNVVPPPQRQGPTPMEAALLQQMQVIEHDVQTSLGMFKAATGESESQQSGKAILALQRESDTGTYHFGANLGVSIRHAGRILVDLIPHYYDTKRIVRILGEDGEVQTAQLDPDQPESMREIQTAEGVKRIYNPGVGKWDVSITVGPSYNTKRMEAAATFVELAKGSGDPATAAVMSYLTVRNSDFNGAEEASKMLKALLPPPVLQAASGDQPIPPQAMAKMAEMGQQMQMMQQAGAELQQENQTLKSGSEQAMMKTQSDHDAKMKALDLDRKVAEEQAKLAREKVEAEYGLKKWTAERDMEMEGMKCDHEREMGERKMAMEHETRERDEAHKIKQEQMHDEATVAPQFAKTLEGIVQAFAQIMEGQQEFQKALVEQMAKPKQVTLGGIRRNDGGITGATATVQ